MAGLQRHVFSIIIISLLLAGTVSATTSLPLPLCARQDFFFYNASSDLTGYKILKNIPELDSARQVTSAPIISTSGEVTLGTWISPAFTSDTDMAPGTWDFRTYLMTSSSSGPTSIHYRVFNLTPTGVKTYFWFGKAVDSDINSGTVPAVYELSYARRNYTHYFTGDRLGVQINISTDSASARTVTMDLAGNTNASMMSTAYWLCGSTSGIGSSGASGSPGVDAPLNPFIPILAMCAVATIFLKRH